MKKLSLSLIAFILVSIVMLGWGMDKLFEYYFWDAQTDPLMNYQDIGFHITQSANNSPDALQYVAQWKEHSSQNRIDLINPNNMPLPENLWQLLYEGDNLILETENGLSIYYWLENHQMVLAFTPDALITQSNTSLIKILLTSGFYIGILLLLLIWLFPLIRSLQNLRRNAVAYSRGDFSNRIENKRFSYIDDIEKTFNHMAGQIETLINDNKLISSAVSHDLRTPLARLRFGIDILSDTEELEERIKYQEHLSRDIDEMQSLVEVLLNYARLEQNMVKLDKHEVSIRDLVIDYAEQNRTDDQAIDVTGSELPMIASGQLSYLKMLFHNILNNAVYYGHNRILIELKETKKSLEIGIHDNGVGIPAEKRSDLFKPFVRGEIKENNAGYGMGLAIAERIASWHQGSIEIEDSGQLKGALFVVTLPKP